MAEVLAAGLSSFIYKPDCFYIMITALVDPEPPRVSEPS